MLLTFENLILMLAVFLIGSCLGSFFKLTADRYGSGDSFIFKPSYCFNCKNKLLWWHNIPVISYLILKGKCFFCKEKIDVNCFYSEIITGLIILALFISGIIKNHCGFTIGLTLLFSSFLILLSIFDLKHRTIPHVITYSAIILFFISKCILREPVLLSLSSLGIAYIFMDLLYFFASLIKRFEPEINIISVPLIIWTTSFFYFHNIYISLIPCVIYLAITRFKVSHKSYITLWIVFFLLLLIQIYKIVFIDLSFSNLSLLCAGFGIIYFICEIMLYFISLFLSPDKNIPESENMPVTSKISIGGGDITVFALISVFLGYKLGFIVLFIASLLAIISHFTIRVISFFKKKPTEQFSQTIPFVPYISMACFIIIMAFYGN